MVKDAGGGRPEAESREELQGRVRELERRLQESEETLRAIRSGDVDALLVEGPAGDKVFTLKGADYVHRALVETIHEGVAGLTDEGLVYYCNSRFAEMLGRAVGRVLGQHLSDLVSGAARGPLEDLLREGSEGFARTEIELSPLAGDEGLYVLASCRALRLEEFSAVCLVLTDVTEQKRAEVSLRQAHDDLRGSEKSLREQAVDLERKNLALKEILGQISVQRNRIFEEVESRVRHDVLPLIEKLGVHAEVALHVKALRQLVEGLASPSRDEAASDGPELSLKEQEICRMIRGGLTSKEIAEALSVSPQTVDKHRKNIRKKLGIAREQVDLGVYLSRL